MNLAPRRGEGREALYQRIQGYEGSGSPPEETDLATALKKAATGAPLSITEASKVATHLMQSYPHLEDPGVLHNALYKALQGLGGELDPEEHEALAMWRLACQ